MNWRWSVCSEHLYLSLLSGTKNFIFPTQTSSLVIGVDVNEIPLAVTRAMVFGGTWHIFGVWFNDMIWGY